MFLPPKVYKKTRQLIQFNKKLSKKKAAKSLPIATGEQGYFGYDMDFSLKK